MTLRSRPAGVGGAAARDRGGARGRRSREEDAHFSIAQPGLGTRVSRRGGDHGVRAADDRRGACRGAGHGRSPACAVTGRSACSGSSRRSNRSSPAASRRSSPDSLLLTLALVSGAFFIENLFAQHLVHKVVAGDHRVGACSACCCSAACGSAGAAAALRWALSGLRAARRCPISAASSCSRRARQALGLKPLARRTASRAHAPPPRAARAVRVLLRHRDGADERQSLPAAPSRARRQPRRARGGALLERPDRLIGLILLCNNFVNIAAAVARHADRAAAGRRGSRHRRRHSSPWS